MFWHHAKCVMNECEQTLFCCAMKQLLRFPSWTLWKFRSVEHSHIFVEKHKKFRNFSSSLFLAYTSVVFYKLLLCISGIDTNSVRFVYVFCGVSDRYFLSVGVACQCIYIYVVYTVYSLCWGKRVMGGCICKYCVQAAADTSFCVFASLCFYQNIFFIFSFSYSLIFRLVTWAFLLQSAVMFTW